MMTLGFALAVVIGLSLGLLGGGGSILTVPVFVYVMGFTAKQAIAMSLPVVGTTSLLGAIGHWRGGTVNLWIALPFGLVAMAGSYLGARLSVLVSGEVQLLLLAIVILVAAISMVRGGARRAEGVPAGPSGAPRARRRGLILLVGLGVGLLTGLLGIGGGFLIVPALVVLADVPMKQAVGTSLLVIAMNATSGLVGHLGQVAIPWGFVAMFAATAVGGVLVGAHLCRFVPQGTLRRAFGAFLVVVGALVLFQNRTVLRPKPAAAAAGAR